MESYLSLKFCSCSIVFQFRGSEILELANFKNATIEDIANVHEKAYVLGLEKVICSPHVILLSIYLLTNFLFHKQPVIDA